RTQSPEQGFYHVYMAHNHHMLTFAAMMTGQSRLAIATINEMVQMLEGRAAGAPAVGWPEWVAENAAIADGFTAMPLEVLVRFGRWDEVLNAPEPPDYFPLARALRHVSRGIAFAAKADAAQARQEQRDFLKAKLAVPAGARFGNNEASDLLAVAELLLDGEIL